MNLPSYKENPKKTASKKTKKLKRLRKIENNNNNNQQKQTTETKSPTLKIRIISID